MPHSRSCGFIDRKFSRLILRVRKELKMSQKEIADHLGLSYQQYQKYESAKNRVSIGRAHQMAEAFGISLADLMAMLESFR